MFLVTEMCNDHLQCVGSARLLVGGFVFTTVYLWGVSLDFPLMYLSRAQLKFSAIFSGPRSCIQLGMGLEL